jgi:uncharacterized protein YndB with AHSA1/START domain
MTDKEVKLVKTYNAPIERVWDAWTNADNIKQWLSPEGMTNPDVSVDLRVGGSYRNVMQGHNMPDPKHNGKMAVGGTYLEIDKPNKLMFTWLWEGEPAETHTSTVTVYLKKIDDHKTELTLIHNGFADDDMQQQHDMGWTSTFRKLEQFLSS